VHKSLLGWCVAVEQLHTHPGGSLIRGCQQRPWLQHLGVELIAGAVVIAVFAAIGDLEGWPFIAFLVVAYSFIGANKKEYREPQVSDG
jgi:hypothetical protein